MAQEEHLANSLGTKFFLYDAALDKVAYVFLKLHIRKTYGKKSGFSIGHIEPSSGIFSNPRTK